MLSFWEKQSLETYDHAIVGAGIMGCSVAFELRQKFPSAKIVVLERGIFPGGASAKNAGFACFGSPTEILNDIALNGEQKTTEIVSRRIEGLNILHKRLGDDKMGLTPYGGYELIFENMLNDDTIDHINHLLEGVCTAPVFSDVSDKIPAFGFSSSVRQLLHCPKESQIDSGMMMNNYWKLLRENNIDIISGAAVKKIDENTMEIRDTSNTYSVKADKIFVCTNAMINELFPEINVKPGRGQVLITQPIDSLPFKGSFHFDGGFYYFRNVGNRLLFGGGRNLDMAGEETTELSINKKILDELTKKIQNIILPGIPFEIEDTWQGIMGFAENKLPQIVPVNKYTTYVMACNGMGVALSPCIARELVQTI